MSAQIMILSPLHVVPGAVDPAGRTVAATTLYENLGAGVLVADVTFEDGSKDAIVWPLGNLWSSPGVTPTVSGPGVNP